jgi:hypothetical protein
VKGVGLKFFHIRSHMLLITLHDFVYLIGRHVHLLQQVDFWDPESSSSSDITEL